MIETKGSLAAAAILHPDARLGLTMEFSKYEELLKDFMSTDVRSSVPCLTTSSFLIWLKEGTPISWLPPSS